MSLWATSPDPQVHHPSSDTSKQGPDGLLSLSQSQELSPTSDQNPHVNCHVVSQEQQLLRLQALALPDALGCTVHDWLHSSGAGEGC